ncbi:MAG TPA: glycosyltransferase family 4 protein [Pseudonocardiaceae bacterium]|nr:glycosyltransferase family 4 protein [Pseudonocardiaceae bacterium]
MNAHTAGHDEPSEPAVTSAPRPRRALWVSTSLNTRGGVSSYVRMLKATPLWQRWDVTHIATHRDGSVPARVLAFVRAALVFLPWVIRGADVVHVHMSSYGSFLRKAVICGLARARGLPVVVHVHGSEFSIFYRRSPRPLQWLIRSTLQHAGAVVALGSQWAQQLAEIAPGARISAIPNAVQIAGPMTEPAPGQPVQVVFLGAIGERKGTFTLLEVWAKIITELPPGSARLIIAGDQEADRAAATMARLGVAETVQLRSWLSPTEVDELLSASHVLTLPSLNEGQPMAILEAMAHGLCIVASDVGGIPDLIEDGVSGLLVPPADPEALQAALQQVITDPATRSRLGAAALQRARTHFDVDVVWKQIDSLYRELTSRSAAADTET